MERDGGGNLVSYLRGNSYLYRSLRSPSVLLSYYLIILLSYYLIILLFNYSIILLSYYPIIRLYFIVLYILFDKGQ